MRLKWVAILLLMCGAASGFIARIFPLKEILDASTNVLVGRIETVDGGKKTAVALIDRAVKGKQEFKRVRMNLGVAPKAHVQYLLARLKPGGPCIVFYKREGKNLASCVHAGDTWFQLFATEEGSRDRLWWRMSHLEVYLGRTYDGSTPNLVKLVDDVLAGRVKPPPPDPKVPKLDPEKALAAAARTRPSPRPPSPQSPKPQPKPAPPTPRAPVDGLEALDGWTVDDSWSRPGKLTVRSAKGRGKVMEVACEGEAGRKLAVAILHHMDVSKATRMELHVANNSRAPLKVSVAFGAAPDWRMHEAPAATVSPSSDPRALSFRLDRAHFKSESSGWKHTQKFPNEGRFDKMMVIVDGLPGKGNVAFDSLRFSHGGFRPAGVFAHGGGEVRGIAWTDVNGDERVDACVSVQKGNLLLVNQGDGSFREQSADFGLKVGSRAASWADYNGDGHPDLLTHNFRLFTNVGGRLRDDSKLIRAPKGRNPEGAGWIDYNGDGRPDVLITNGEHGIRLYENTGKPPAWFRDVSDKAGLGPKGIGVGNGDFVAFADLNTDGYTDFFYNLGKGVLARNNGDGKFLADTRSGIELPGGAGPKRGLAFADFDLDDDLDVFVPGPGRPRLYRNNNDGTFTDVLQAAGDLAGERDASFSAAWGDVNNDGAPDLFVCHTSTASQLYLGDGRGKFTDVTEQVRPGGFPSCFAASFADVDADGDLDLLMNLKDRAVLAVNELDIAEGRAALVVDVQAAKGVTGAVVRVLDDAGRPLGIRELTGAESCGGQTSPVAHFGVKRGGTVKVSVGLSDGRLAQKRVSVDRRVTRISLRERDFK